MERVGGWESVLGLLWFIPFPNISAGEHSLGRRGVGWTLGVMWQCHHHTDSRDEPCTFP